MKKYPLSLLWTFIYVSAFCSFKAYGEPVSGIAAKISTHKKYISDADRSCTIEHSDIDVAYIPKALKNAVRTLNLNHPELTALIDLSIFTDETIDSAPLEIVQQYTRQLITILTDSALRTIDPDDTTIAALNAYLQDLTEIAHADQSDIKSVKKRSPANTQYGVLYTDLVAGTMIATTTSGLGTDGQLLIASSSAGPAFALLTSNAGTIAITPGSNSLNIDITDGPTIATSFPTDYGTAIPSYGELIVAGGSNINTSGTLSTVTINLDDSPSVSGSITAGTGFVASNGGINATGNIILHSVGTGVMSTSTTGLVSSNPTTANAVQIGNASGTLTSLGVGTNGQVLIGANSATPAFASLTSTGGTIAFTPGTNSLDLETAGSIPTAFPADYGTAYPDYGILNIMGGSNISTSGSGDTVEIDLVNSPSVSGTVIAGTGFVASNGGINATGNIILHSVGIGVMSTSATGLVSSHPTTANAVQIGNASGNLTSLGVGTNGQILIGANSAAPAFASLTSNTIAFTSGANSLELETVGTIPTSFPTDYGTAYPDDGVLNINGDSNIFTTGSGSTVDIHLVNSPSVSGTVTAGSGFIASNGGINATGNALFSSGTFGVNSGTNEIDISNDAANTTVMVGTGAGNKTVTLGSTNAASTTTVQSGAGGINVATTDGGLLTINSGTGTMGISNDSFATTVNIAATGAGPKTVTLGSTTTSSATTVQSGTGGVNITTNSGPVNITAQNGGALTINSGTGTLSVSTDPTTTTVNLGTGAGVKTVTLGSTIGGSTTTIQSGGGGLNITTNNGGSLGINSGAGTMTLTSTGTINIGTGAGLTVTVGPSAGAGLTTVQSGAGGLSITANGGPVSLNSGAGTMSIASNTTTNLNIGTSTAVKTVTVGSTTGGSTTTIQGATGGLNITATSGGPLTMISGTGAMNISNDAFATTLNIGTGAGVKAVTIGSTNTTSSLALNFGGSTGSPLSNYTVRTSYTPALTFATPPTGFTSSPVGYYCSIGSLVIFSATITVSAIGSGGSGAASISLPVAANATSTFFTVDLQLQNTTFSGFAVGNIAAGSSTAALQSCTSGAAATNLAYSNFTTGSIVNITGCYLR